MEWHSVLLSAVGSQKGSNLGVKTDIWISRGGYGLRQHCPRTC